MPPEGNQPSLMANIMMTQVATRNPGTLISI